MKNLTKLMFAMALTSTVLTSCKDKDVYDPSYKEAELAANFTSEFGNVATDQNFNTSESATLTATVELDYGATYTIAVFDQCPVGNSDAKILGQADIVSPGSANISFAKDKMSNSLYVSCIYPTGYMASKPFVLNDSTSNAVYFGYGSIASATRTRSVTSDGSVTVETLDAPDFDSYLTGATEITADNNTETTEIRKFKITEGEWTANIPILQSATGVTIYVGDGAVWRISSEQRVNVDNTIVVAKGGKIIIESGASLTTNGSGTSGNGVGMVYVQTGGSITGDGTLRFYNGTEENYSYNGGTIDVGTLDLNGGTLYNAAGATVDADELNGGSSNSLLINQGYAHFGNAGATDNGDHESYSGLCFKNACNIVVDQNLEMNGYNECADGSYIVANDIYNRAGTDLETSYTLMGHNAVINAKRYVYFLSHGLIGPSDASTGKALYYFSDVKKAQCEDNVSGGHNTHILNYVELICTDSSVNFDDNTNWGSNPHWMLCHHMLGNHVDYGGGTVWVNVSFSESELKATISEDGASYSKDASDCAPAIESVTETKTISYDGETYTVAFEDLGNTDDFDFNDIVLYVTVGGYTKTFTYTDGVLTDETTTDNDGVIVKVMAAGGTLPVKVYYGDELILNKTSENMLNTSSWDKVIATYNIENTSGFNMAESSTVEKFQISVAGTSATYLVNANVIEGDAPQALVIKGEWYWPKERVNVGTAYSGFKDWVGNTIYGSWYSSYEEKYVIIPSNY